MKRKVAPISSVVFLSLLLSGCATAGHETSENDSVESLNEAVEVEQPKIYDNCGVTVTLDQPPEQVITIKSTTLEMMLALGLEDRIVGSAFLDGPVPDELKPQGWEPNIISDRVPARELLLSLESDFIFAGWTSNLSADGTGTREDLMGMGINSYIPPLACDFGEESDTAFTFDDIFDMLTEVGDIMDVPERASALIEEQKAQLESYSDTSRPTTTALWYSSGDDTPFVGGGTGIPNMIMEAAGITNQNADFPEPWLSMSWEAFVESDPDVIVLVSTPWNTAEDKAQRLEAHPAASTMRAVQNKNYISVDFATTEAGVRNVEAVETIITSLKELNR